MDLHICLISERLVIRDHLALNLPNQIRIVSCGETKVAFISHFRVNDLPLIVIIVMFETVQGKNIMIEILTVKNRQKNHIGWNLFSWYELSAVVTTVIQRCDVLYNQRTVFCDTQSAWLRSGVTVNLPMFKQWHCYETSGSTK